MASPNPDAERALAAVLSGATATAPMAPRPPSRATKTPRPASANPLLRSLSAASTRPASAASAGSDKGRPTTRATHVTPDVDGAAAAAAAVSPAKAGAAAPKVAVRPTSARPTATARPRTAAASRDGRMAASVKATKELGADGSPTTRKNRLRGMAAAAADTADRLQGVSRPPSAAAATTGRRTSSPTSPTRARLSRSSSPTKKKAKRPPKPPVNPHLHWVWSLPEPQRRPALADVCMGIMRWYRRAVAHRAALQEAYRLRALLEARRERWRLASAAQATMRRMARKALLGARRRNLAAIRIQRVARSFLAWRRDVVPRRIERLVSRQQGLELCRDAFAAITVQRAWRAHHARRRCAAAFALQAHRRALLFQRLGRRWMPVEAERVAAALLPVRKRLAARRILRAWRAHQAWEDAAMQRFQARHGLVRDATRPMLRRPDWPPLL